MTQTASLKLDNYEDEDIFDVIAKLEKSFVVKFNKTAFAKAATFGDICDTIQSHINYKHKESCTKQQAFYKIRKAIDATLLIGEKQISIDSNLADLFPKKNRRQKINEFQSYLDFKSDILTYPGWLASALASGLVLSCIAFFFDWKIAISGIIFFILAAKIAENSGKDLTLQTVRQLTEKSVTENYMVVRRSKGTVNQNEILKTMVDAFSTNLGIDKEYLTREAKLG